MNELDVTSLADAAQIESKSVRALQIVIESAGLDLVMPVALVIIFEIVPEKNGNVAEILLTFVPPIEPRGDFQEEKLRQRWAKHPYAFEIDAVGTTKRDVEANEAHLEAARPSDHATLTYARSRGDDVELKPAFGEEPMLGACLIVPPAMNRSERARKVLKLDANGQIHVVGLSRQGDVAIDCDGANEEDVGLGKRASHLAKGGELLGSQGVFSCDHGKYFLRRRSATSRERGSGSAQSSA